MAANQTYINSKGQTVDMSTGQVVGGGNQGLGTASPTPYGASAPSTNLNTIQTGVNQAQQQALAIQQQIKQLQPSAPTNVNQVQPTGSVNMPDLTPKTTGTDGVGGLVSFYTDLFKTYDQQQKDIQAQQKEAQAAQQKQTQGFLDSLMKSKSPGQVRADAEAETGIAPQEYFAEQKAQIAEIDSLNKEYNELIAQRDEQIAALEGQGRGIPLDLLDNQRARIERNAAPRINQVSANINSKAAILEASQGRFAEAQNYVNNAVNAATEELNYNFKLFQTFYDINQDSINRLDAKYQDAFKGALGAAEAAYTTAYDEKNRIGELMLKYPNAGISINDSLDKAYGKAGVPRSSGTTLTDAVLSGLTNLNDLTASDRAEVLVDLQKKGYGSSTPPKWFTDQLQKTSRQSLRPEIVQQAWDTERKRITSASTATSFTDTQINKGANNAGVAPADFTSYPTEVQNYYISSTASQLKDINGLISGVKTGEQKAEDVLNLIESSNAPQAVKDHLAGKLQTEIPLENTKSWWEGVKGFLGL